jgi:hypothetical protein
MTVLVPAATPAAVPKKYSAITASPSFFFSIGTAWIEVDPHFGQAA